MGTYFKMHHSKVAIAYVATRVEFMESPTVAAITAACSCSSSYLLFPFQIDYILIL
jgi:hypothetical protein